MYIIIYYNPPSVHLGLIKYRLYTEVKVLLDLSNRGPKARGLINQ